MISVVAMSGDGRSLVEGGEALLDRPGLRWVDLVDPTGANIAPLAERFGLHRLAVEDCLHLDQRPKLEQYPNHHFLVLHGFTAPGEDPCATTLHEVHVLIGTDWVMTVHEGLVPALDDARRRFRADPPGTFARGPDFIAYAIADALVDSNFPLVDGLHLAIEQLEEDTFGAANGAHLRRMFAIKRTLVHLRKVLSPQRDVLNALSRPGGFVQERTALYFRDVSDHLTRLQESLDSARELVADARDAYLSSVANRTNDITRQLTIFASLFLPLSFITGFFGQNFDVLSRPVFFWSMLGMIFLFPVLLIGWFRYKRWL